MGDRRWWLSVTPPAKPGGEYVAWATERPAPRNATVATMLTFPGEVHFELGATATEALRALEAELP